MARDEVPARKPRASRAPSRRKRAPRAVAPVYDRTRLLLDAFDTSRLLRGLSPERLLQMAQSCVQSRYTPGETIFREGDPSGGLYLVVQGTVRVITRSPTNDVLLASVTAGETIGEMGVIDGTPRSATAVAATLSVLEFIPTDAFLDLLQAEPMLAMRMLAMLSERLRRTNRFIAELPGRISRAPHAFDG